MLKDMGIRSNCYMGQDQDIGIEIKFPTEEEFWEAKREEEDEKDEIDNRIPYGIRT